MVVRKNVTYVVSEEAYPPINSNHATRRQTLAKNSRDHLLPKTIHVFFFSADLVVRKNVTYVVFEGAYPRLTTKSDTVYYQNGYIIKDPRP